MAQSPVYSTSFALINSGAGIDYTVPAGYVAVLRCLTLANRSSSAVEQVQLRTTTPSVILVEASLPAFSTTSAMQSLVVDLHVVLAAGIHLEGLGTALVDASLSGYLLAA